MKINTVLILCKHRVYNSIMNSLTKAIEFFGSQSKLANALGVVPMTITQWKKRQVPVDQAIKIEQITDGKVTKEGLRPDIFQPQTSS